MKKLSLLLTLLLVLGLFTSASAIDQKGKFAIGGALGYSFGFGDVFKEYQFGYVDPDLGFVGWKYQNKLSFSFGAKAKYGISSNLAIGGIIEYQGGDVDVKAQAGGFGAGLSESYHWTNILASIIYSLSPEKKTVPYLGGGAGLYMGEDVTKPGVHAGGGIEHFFKNNLALDAGARFHMIFTEGKSTTYVNGYVGLNYYLGVK